MTPENEARALICLVYENDRCLLHVGLIKIIGIHALLKPTTGHIHHRGYNDSFSIKKKNFENVFYRCNTN